MRFYFSMVLVVAIATCGLAQNIGINLTGVAADPSALLDVDATNKGILIPRLTIAQRNGITTPATGLLIYQTEAPTGFWYYDGVTWIHLSSSIETFQVTSTAAITPVTGGWTLIPGMAQSVVITTPSTVQLHAQGGIQSASSAAGGQAQVDVAIFQNGLIINPTYRRVLALNNSGLGLTIQNFSTNTLVTLVPGTYNFAVYGLKSSSTTSNAALGGNALSVLQGTLDITIYPK